jgi:isopentenyl-diphosphate delta-isomerase
MVMEEAAYSRLKEEMGFSVPLKHLKTFHYRVEFDNGLIENEIDHIYVGFFNQEPKPNPKEVANYKLIDLPSIKKEIELHPEEFTYWFRHIVKHYYQELLAASKNAY